MGFGLSVGSLSFAVCFCVREEMLLSVWISWWGCVQCLYLSHNEPSAFCCCLYLFPVVYHDEPITLVLSLFLSHSERRSFPYMVREC